MANFHETIETFKGIFEVEYFNADSFDNLPYAFHRSAGICIFDNQIILCRGKDGKLQFPGGSIEVGETRDQALIREVEEESNMKVLDHAPIGWQKMWNDTTPPRYQAFYYAQVEPIGPFTQDPAGHIVEIIFEDADFFQSQQVMGTRGKILVDRAMEIHHRRLSSR